MGDACVGEFAGCAGVNEGLEVGAIAGYEDGEVVLPVIHCECVVCKDVVMSFVTMDVESPNFGTWGRLNPAMRR